MQPHTRRPASLADADDRTLAGRAADGDVRAFEVLVRRHGPLMRAYATRLLGSATETDDVVQDAFIAAWQRLPQQDDLGSIKNWLMGIVRNKSVDRIRANRHHVDIGDFDPAIPDDLTPHRQSEAGARRLALGEALAALPAGQRRSWELKEIGGYSYAEIAADLGIPESTARGLLARARKNLIRDMEVWR